MMPKWSMRASPSHTVLQLLVSGAGDRNAEPIILLPEAPGSGANAIARSLVESRDGGHTRLLPAPSLDADVRAQRAWHRDAWLAMPAVERDAVVLVTGPTAGYLGPVLADAARTVVLVCEPRAAAGLTGDVPTKRHTLERLAESAVDDLPARLHGIANPQSRRLLAPWHDPAELIVGPGPPSDADRWRDALFGDVLPHVDASPVEEAPRVARALAGSVGARPKPVVQAARAVLEGQSHFSEDPDVAELLLRFNWLDAELYDRCVNPRSQTG
jgi:hypothetical protein